MMAEQRGANIRESVEEILARLYISGSIKDGKLLKTDLQNETKEYISQKNITDFTYADMPKAMLKYDYCRFMKKELAHKSRHFEMVVEKIQNISLKHTDDTFEEEVEHFEGATKEEQSDDDKYLSAKMNYVTTIIRRKLIPDSENQPNPPNQCIACQIKFRNQVIFEKHMKSHGKQFSMNGNEIMKKVNMVIEPGKNGDSIVCQITTLAEYLKLVNVALIAPPYNHIICRNRPDNENCMKFHIYCKSLDNTDHPYSVLIFYKDDLDNLMITQYHIKMMYTDSKDDDQPEVIKLRKQKTKLWVEKLKLKPLPDHYVGKNVKSMSRKNFRIEKLNEEEKVQLRIINALCKRGPTPENYTYYWTLFSEIEECAQQEEMSKFDKKEAKLKNGPDGLYILDVGGISDSDHTGVVREGDKVSIAPTKTPRKKIYARVHQILKKAIVLDLEDGKSLDLSNNNQYDLKFLQNRTCFQLEREALRFVKEHYLFNLMFPSKTNGTFTLNEYIQFNWFNESFYQNLEQQSAVTHIVQKTSHPAPYILMGPPGTGKTTTIVEAICQIIRKDPSVHILVVARSNYACNEIALRLIRFISKEKIYRMFTSSKEQELDSIDPELIEISNLKHGSHYYPALKILKEYNVVICTLAVSGKFAQARIDCEHFSYVFIDECGSCTEPETLIPIAGVISSSNKIHGQVVICGDPKQLGPVIKAEMAKDTLGVSLLERLIDTGIYTKDPRTGRYNPQVMTMLLRNYRSHPKILEFPNKKFYSGGLLAMGGPEITRWACGWKHLPNKMVPIVFCHVEGKTEEDDSSPSLFNKAEVNEVVAYIEGFLNVGKIGGKDITQKCIGVISPYKKQCQKIELECTKRRWKDIAIGSVDLFQGQEKPIIIFSTVRSNTNTLGFLNNPKRLNVALTRAQGLLIVIGNNETLQKDDLWSEFIDFCKENDLIKMSKRKFVQKSKEVKQKKQKDRNTKKMEKKMLKSQDFVSFSKASPAEEEGLDELFLLPDVPKDENIQNHRSANHSMATEPLLPKLPISLRNTTAPTESTQMNFTSTGTRQTTGATVTTFSTQFLPKQPVSDRNYTVNYERVSTPASRPMVTYSRQSANIVSSRSRFESEYLNRTTSHENASSYDRAAAAFRNVPVGFSNPAMSKQESSRIQKKKSRCAIS